MKCKATFESKNVLLRKHRTLLAIMTAIVVTPRIPQLIHQTWKTREVPAQWASSVEKYRALQDEGWEHKLWTDEDNRQLIQEHYSWFLAQFDAYPYPIQRADAIRYFILHKYGGVYSDLDIQPKPNFTAFYKLYQHAELALPCTKAGNAFGGQNFSNCFMMSAPGCAFWPLVWERLKEPYARTAWWKPLLGRAHYFQVLFTTGPGLICDAAAEYKGDIVALPAQLIQPGVESDRAPVSKPESVVELLKGESWQQSDAGFWRTCGKVMNYASWLLLGLCAFLAVMVIFLAVKLYRCNKTASAASSHSRTKPSVAYWATTDSNVQKQAWIF